MSDTLKKEWDNRSILHELIDLQARAVIEWLRQQWDRRNEVDLGEVVLHAKNHIGLLICRSHGFCAYTNELKKNITEILDRAWAGNYEKMFYELNEFINSLINKEEVKLELTDVITYKKEGNWLFSCTGTIKSGSRENVHEFLFDLFEDLDN